MKESLKTWLILFIGLLLPLLSFTQEVSTEDTLRFVPKALELGEISDFGTETRKLLNDIEFITENDNQLNDINRGVEDMMGVLAKKKAYFSDTLKVFQLVRLEREERELALLNQRITEWKDVMQQLERDISAKDSVTANMIQVWQMTLDTMNLQSDTRINSADSATIDNLRTVVERFMLDLTVAKDTLTTLSDEVPDIQTQIALAENQSGDISQLIAARQEVLVKNFWISEAPPIWRMRPDQASSNVGEHVLDVLKSDWRIIEVFLKANPRLPQYALLILTFIFSLIVYLRFQSKRLYDDYQEQLKGGTIVLQNPMIATLMICWFISALVNIFPKELKDLITLFMLVPLIIVIRKMEQSWNWQKVFLFACTFLLALIVREIDYNFLSSRLFLLVVDLLILSSMVYLFKHEQVLETLNEYWYRTVPFFVRSVAILSAIAILSNIVGSVQFAQLLSYAALGIIVVIFVVKAVVFLTRDFLFLILMGPFTQYSNILKEDGQVVLNKIDKLLKLIAFVLMIGIVLDFFGAKNLVLELLINIIAYEISVGEISFSLGNILAFIITIQLSIWISSLIRYVLEKEVFPRTTMSQGVPNTILLMIKFAFVLFGILLAFSAAGIQIDKLAIVVGALGVGIGFGLQNIVNNFVSGIILALERPVTIGDIIDIPGASGTVKDIGIRASTVRQWDGSDVIVPNGELISGKLTNWTFSDKLRRVKVDVRLPFGTNIEEVSSLLLETAKNIPDVMQKPEPFLNFKGIGTSALEINLYCWIRDSGLIFSLGTAIRKTVYKSLAEAGYDIPVPRQDLSITSEKKT